MRFGHGSGVAGGDGLRISVVRYDKPLPAMPEDSEPTPVEGPGGYSVASGNGWRDMHGNGEGEEGAWGVLESTKVEEANCECCISVLFNVRRRGGGGCVHIWLPAG